MQVSSMEELIVNMTCAIMSKGKNCLFGTLDPHGDTTVQGGSKRVKGQFMKSKWVIPHSIIADRMKTDISVINHAFIGPMGAVPASFMNEEGRAMKSRVDDRYSEALKGSPRLCAAIKELIAAIDEEQAKSIKKELKELAAAATAAKDSETISGIDKALKRPKEELDG